MTKVVCTTTLPPPIVYEAIDLGLPSGTKWATTNVGARKPSDYGLYFQWGDISGYTADQVGTGEGKKKFASDWIDYKWRLSGDSDDNVAFTKYTTPGATLELEDDAAHVHMGGDWHMPTLNQILELIDNTSDGWTNYEGVGGWKFISKKDTSKSIFIPAAGYVDDGNVRTVNRSGLILSSKLNMGDIKRCISLHFSSDYGGSVDTNAVNKRSEGFSVRGVIG